MSWKAQMGFLLSAAAEPTMAPVRLGDRVIDAAMACTPREWGRGLQGHDLDRVSAMLFVMPDGSHLPFHVAGLRRELLLAFFNAQGHLLELVCLNENYTVHRPFKAYAYVLEMVEPDLSIGLIQDLTAGLDVTSLPRLDGSPR